MRVSTVQPFSNYREFFRKVFGPVVGGRLFSVPDALGHTYEEREAYYRMLAAQLAQTVHGERHTSFDKQYRVVPVDIETFVRDRFYLNMDMEIYPTVLPYLIEMNSGKYVEVVLTGGIGSAKTTLALLTNAYQLYLLSLTRNPHAVFNLDKASEIELIFQNITATLAESVDFARFKSLIDHSPYFNRYFPYNKNLKSELHFPNRIIVKPVSGSSLATLGQNVIGGLIDELNYMAVVEGSRRAVDEGIYDQAVALYNSISRRRRSRYLKQGRLPGILCLVSSKKYPGQFTDQKVEEAKSDPTIYVYDKRVWDIKPDSFSKKKFRVFVGDDFRKPRILSDKEVVKEKDGSLMVEVPDDFRVDFEKDIVNALREIGGVSHLSRSPLILDYEVMVKCFKKRDSILSREVADFVERDLKVYKETFFKPELPRWAHIDLGLTSDNAGVAIGMVPGFMAVNRSGSKEMLPLFRFDAVLAVAPPKNGEILFWKIRRLLYLLREMGLNIRWVSFDTYQSVDSMQLLRQQGFVTGIQSVDTTGVPYDFLKSAFYDGRVDCPEHEVAMKELRDLQRDEKTGKVDHLPNGSKDCTDAMAGVVYGLTMRREIWIEHGVSPVAFFQKTEGKVSPVRGATTMAEKLKDPDFTKHFNVVK
jgi:hypothetical protein